MSVALLAAGCAAVPNLGPAPMPLAADRIAASGSLPAQGAAWPDDQWWRAFDDPQLTALIEEGLRNSPDVAAAVGRFRRAAGLAQEAGGATLPSVNAQGSVTLNKQSYNYGFPQEFLPQGWQDYAGIAAVIGFDLDIWGRNRAALAAATSERQAAAVDVRQARIMLAAGIASAYADFQRLNEELELRRAALGLREKSRRLVGERTANGLDTAGSQSLSEAQAATARAQLSATEQDLKLRRNQIAALVGAGPDRGLALTAPTLAAPAGLGLPDDVTTDLVARRPDVSAALARVTAAAGRIKVARADFFPALRLDALIGAQSLGVENLFKSGSDYGNAGPAINLPLFRGGALQGRYRQARGGYEEAVAFYDRTVLDAYRDVADAVAMRDAIARRLRDARAALAASEKANDVAQLRYNGGLSSYLDAVIVEDRLLEAREAVTALEAAARAADISLIRALGGGFAPAGRPNAKDYPDE